MQIEWIGKYKLFLDKSKMATYYTINMLNLFSSLSLSEVTPTLELFMQKAKSSSNSANVGFRRGIGIPYVRFMEYTDTLGTSVLKNAVDEEFTALGFSSGQIAHM